MENRDIYLTLPASAEGLQTAYIQAALDACREGGGTVTLADGLWRVGSVRLYSNTTLRLSSGTVLQEGDIVNVDVSTIYKGYFSDSSRMYCIGKVSPEREKLVRVAKECMDLGLAQVKPWNFLGDMAQAINDHAKANGYSVVVDIGGHGIGLEFHEEPFVSYVTPAGTEMLMVPGMVFTIEPMVNAGTCDVVVDDEDGWTVYTEDGKDSAQWEITVAVTKDGYEILTY